MLLRWSSIFLMFFFLSSCGEMGVVTHPFSGSLPYKAVIPESYAGAEGKEIRGVIPNGAEARVRITLDQDFEKRTDRGVFYWVALTGKDVFNPPFENFEEFKALAKEFSLSGEDDYYDIVLENKEEFKSEPNDERNSVPNDGIGTVYSVYVVLDDPNFVKGYNFRQPVADFKAPKGVGELKLPSWIASSGKWSSNDENLRQDMVVKFSTGGTSDEVFIRRENSPESGTLLINKGRILDSKNRDVSDFNGGGAVTDYGILPDRSGAYVTVGVVHKESLFLGSYVKFVVKYGQNNLFVEDYNALSQEMKKYRFSNVNKHYRVDASYPLRYRPQKRGTTATSTLN